VKLFVFLACNNYDDFQHLRFIFSPKIVPQFQGLFTDETEPQVKQGNVVIFKLVVGSSKALKHFLCERLH
jgi:hypothetical protein